VVAALRSAVIAAQGVEISYAAEAAICNDFFN